MSVANRDCDQQLSSSAVGSVCPSTLSLDGSDCVALAKQAVLLCSTQLFNQATAEGCVLYLLSRYVLQHALTVNEVNRASAASESRRRSRQPTAKLWA